MSFFFQNQYSSLLCAADGNDISDNDGDGGDDFDDGGDESFVDESFADDDQDGDFKPSDEDPCSDDSSDTVILDSDASDVSDVIPLQVF